jgi:hypothetical protein
MRRLMLTAGALASVASLMAVPDMADARTHHRHHHEANRCAARTQRNSAIGAVSGAVGGAFIGSALSHNNGGATLLGAGARALTGHALARRATRC